MVLYYPVIVEKENIESEIPLRHIVAILKAREYKLQTFL